jgi:hypothetical protein
VTPKVPVKPATVPLHIVDRNEQPVAERKRAQRAQEPGRDRAVLRRTLIAGLEQQGELEGAPLRRPQAEQSLVEDAGQQVGQAAN